MATTKNSNGWTEEERKLAYDTDCPLTLAGDRRCASRYKGIDWFYNEEGDEDGVVADMRCINAATVRIHVVENPYESYDAVACDTCASRLNEPPPEFSSSSPSFGVVGGNTVTIIGRL